MTQPALFGLPLKVRYSVGSAVPPIDVAPLRSSTFYYKCRKSKRSGIAGYFGEPKRLACACIIVLAYPSGSDSCCLFRNAEQRRPLSGFCVGKNRAPTPSR